MTRLAVAMLVLLLAAPSARAHQITVFATVEAGEVLIEATFADGTPVLAGTLEIRDAVDAVILTAPIDGTYPIRFPVGDHTDGLVIKVDAGNGHENYWILTPADLDGVAGN